MDQITTAGLDWASIGQEQLANSIALRRAIHADPEIGLHCPRTTEKIEAALAGLPLEFRKGPSSTGLIAVLRTNQGNGRTVLLRGDMDALPMQEETGLAFASRIDGAMHACGHDAHTAMLVGAAKALCAKREELCGTIVFMFQPGEEGWHGARHMIEDGLLDDPRPDAAFALHVSPNLPRGVFSGIAGPAMASADTLHVTVEGRGGHAAMPSQTLDPIPVACEIVMALQAFIARQIPTHDPAVLTIAKITTGSAQNIIPSHAEMLGTLRTLSEETRRLGHEGFKRIVHHVAAAHGMIGHARVEQGFPVTVNDARAVALVRETARQLGGQSSWLPMPAPKMGAEDFSYVLQKIPGAINFIGVAAENSDIANNPPLHNTRMTLDEATMADGIAMHCASAERFLAGGFGD